MSVQAHHPSRLFIAEPCNRGRAKDCVQTSETFQMQRNPNINSLPSAQLLPLYNSGPNFGSQQVLNGGTVFSDPESELTCNLSGSWKRPREEEIFLTTQNQQQQQIAQHLPFMSMNNLSSFSGLNNPQSSVALPQAIPMVSTGLQLSATYDETARLNPSSAATASQSNLVPIFGDNLAAQIQQQQHEMEHLLKLHSDKFRAAILEKRRAHVNALLGALQKGVVAQMRNREAKLEGLNRRNLELEEQVKQLSIETQLWQNLAKNNEATVTTLRANLEQALAQSREQQIQQSRESVVAEDAQSCCNDGDAEDEYWHSTIARENRELKDQRMCKCCKRNQSSILLLPCRHLCLCKKCESALEVCPVCKSAKNASVQVYLS